MIQPVGNEVANKTRQCLLESIEEAERLSLMLSKIEGMDQKNSALQAERLVNNLLKEYPSVAKGILGRSSEEKYVLLLAVALDRGSRLFSGALEGQELDRLVEILLATENFYAPIGGLLGYYLETLRLIAGGKKGSSPELFPPPSVDMRVKTEAVLQYCYEGIRRLSEVGFIFTVGGTGDRLRLTNDKGEPLPVARLSFLGKTLLEWLFRDVEALEYLHYRMFGKPVSCPVLLMASQEKRNAEEIKKLCEEKKWFGKSVEEVQVLVQPLVPTVGLDGQWTCGSDAHLIAKPGGHGAIWKLAADQGAFAWLTGRGVSTVLVRQINNPLPSLDHTIPSFLGLGLTERKSFGFASCPQQPGFAEGMNVLAVNELGMAGIINIEYTLFEQVRAGNSELFDGTCPANINMLFANIEAVQRALELMPIPGTMINAKVEADVHEDGKTVRKPVVRLESMMQSISEVIQEPLSGVGAEKKLPTFLALYDRAKSMSVTKKASVSTQAMYETPESCLYDWYVTSRQLLSEICAIEIPALQSFEEVFQQGPNCFFIFHPALGPFWEIIGEKIQKGRLLPGAELELDIAEVLIRDLSLQGSLRILADSVTGIDNKIGRAVFQDVTIENEGLCPGSAKQYVDRSIERCSSCTIHLQGASEFIANSVFFRGNFEYTVRNGIRAIAIQRFDGEIEIKEEPLISL